MNTETLNVDYLKALQACQSGIDFCINNKLIGFPLNRLNEVQGDYNGFVDWLRKNLKVIRKFDKNNNKIKVIRKFDEKNNLIWKKYPDGKEYHYDYDEKNNLIWKKYPDGDEYYWRYDHNNNKIYAKYPDGSEYHYSYDHNNNLIYEKHPDGAEVTYAVEYYVNGQLKCYETLLIPQF